MQWDQKGDKIANGICVALLYCIYTCNESCMYQEQIYSVCLWDSEDIFVMALLLLCYVCILKKPIVACF